MKIEINPLLGTVRGRIGDLVFKQVNGKSYVAARPHPRSKSSYSGAERAKQKRFAMNTKLASAINKIDVLKPLWQKAANERMSTHNAISKANYPSVGNKEFLIAPKLTPDSLGIDESRLSFKYSDGIISICFPSDVFGLVMNPDNDKSIMAAGVLYLSNPVYDCRDDFKFISLNSDPEKICEGKDSVLQIQLMDIHKQYIDSYANRSFFFCLISLDKDGNLLNTVSTFAESF